MQQELIIIDPVILSFAVALGIGLLIGAEREHRKGEGPTRSPSGIRTFTIAPTRHPRRSLRALVW